MKIFTVYKVVKTLISKLDLNFNLIVLRELISRKILIFGKFCNKTFEVWLILIVS